MTMTVFLTLWLVYGIWPVSWGWLVALVLVEMLAAALNAIIREVSR